MIIASTVNSKVLFVRPNILPKAPVTAPHKPPVTAPQIPPLPVAAAPATVPPTAPTPNSAGIASILHLLITSVNNKNTQSLGVSILCPTGTPTISGFASADPKSCSMLISLVDSIYFTDTSLTFAFFRVFSNSSVNSCSSFLFSFSSPCNITSPCVRTRMARLQIFPLSSSVPNVLVNVSTIRSSSLWNLSVKDMQ